MRRFFLNLININTNQSSNIFVMLMVCVVGLLLLLCCGFAIVVESIKPERISIDFFNGISQIVLAVSTLFGVVGLNKVLGDKWRKKNSKEDKNNN